MEDTTVKDTELESAMEFLSTCTPSYREPSTEEIERIVEASTVCALESWAAGCVEYAYGHAMSAVLSRFPGMVSDKDTASAVRGILVETLFRMASRMRACTRKIVEARNASELGR